MHLFFRENGVFSGHDGFLFMAAYGLRTIGINHTGTDTILSFRLARKNGAPSTRGFQAIMRASPYPQHTGFSILGRACHKPAFQIHLFRMKSEWIGRLVLKRKNGYDHLPKTDGKFRPVWPGNRSGFNAGTEKTTFPCSGEKRIIKEFFRRKGHKGSKKGHRPSQNKAFVLSSCCNGSCPKIR